MTNSANAPEPGLLVIGGAALNTRTWSRAPTRRPDTHAALEGLRAAGAAGGLRHIVVGVIGPREATEPQLLTAERIGRALAELGVTVICGGRTGVMHAASKGCAEAGGLVIGLLPGSTPEEANPFVGVPLPTGLGEARNMVIAKSARVLVAIGGSYGTLSEVAYGLHFSKRVIGLEGAPEVEGVTHAATVAEAMAQVAHALIESAPLTEDLPDV